MKIKKVSKSPNTCSVPELMALRFRQIHMDFHTSEAIDRVAAEFDPDEFADTLARARVNSVTCFARCHHGWLYYDSRRFPELIHPTLTRRRLLEEQIEACHRRDIRVPVYTTVNWDHHTAVHHPEWRQVKADGNTYGAGPLKASFHDSLCLNTPYVDFLKSHVLEILDSMPVDGLFFDIVVVNDCVCSHCRRDMLTAGINVESPEARIAFSRSINDRFRLEMSELVRTRNRDCSIFYNQGHIGHTGRASAEAFTHYELESLPSGGWGYMHFPLAARYARTLGRDCLGMTGKFHTSWGDFHSYKNKAALEFECFQMLAQNAKCSIGDQLHPNGRIDPFAYELIGSVYRQVEAKEPWCRQARPVVDIGVLHDEEFTGVRISPSAAGAVRMLQESGHQFDMLDSQSDLAPYKVLILPDHITLAGDLLARVGDFIAAGGKAILSFESGLNPDRSAFALDALGVRLRPDPTPTPAGTLARNEALAPTNDYTDYVRPRESLGKGLFETDYATYLKGVEIEAAGADVLADAVAPAFNRSWRHFCSHRQAPSSGRVDYPAVTRRGNIIYFAHPLFKLYGRRAPLWCKIMLQNALDLLLRDPILRHDGPSSILATVNEQSEENRWIVHLLHYIPERRGSDLDTIEDVIPVPDLSLSVRVPKPVRSVRTVPRGDRLPHASEGGRTTFTLPVLRGHEMVELQF
jgi:hypothetical protein